jgi:hypothetical protein
MAKVKKYNAGGPVKPGPDKKSKSSVDKTKQEKIDKLMKTGSFGEKFMFGVKHAFGLNKKYGGATMKMGGSISKSKKK